MKGKRVRVAVRDQMCWREESLDQLLPPEHAVRSVWAFVCALDLDAFYQRIRVTPHSSGGSAFDPRTLLTLWLQATLDGVGSGRDLEDLCRHHLVYQWICGGAPINYHTLNDFRTAAGAALDQLLTQSASTLCHAGVASLQRVAQDGVRVRANAGSSSFRRDKTLTEHLAEAEEQVQLLKAHLDDDRGAASRRSVAAKAHAAADRVERVTRALEELTKLRAANAARAASRADAHRAKKPEQLRSSETDPESRKMKMADGGFRPAFNVQFATTTAGGVIVGVAVSNDGTDAKQLVPMVEQLQRRYDRVPAEVLVDGGFVGLEAIEAGEQLGVTVYAPLKEEAKQLAAGLDPYAKKKGDSPELAGWRQRMGTDVAKAIYRERGPTAEWTNALARQRGLQQFRVRGLAKVLTMATWFALAHNAHQGVTAGVWKP